MKEFVIELTTITTLNVVAETKDDAVAIAYKEYWQITPDYAEHKILDEYEMEE